MLLFLYKWFPFISFDSGSRGWRGREDALPPRLGATAQPCQALLRSVRSSSKATVHLHTGLASLPLPGSVPLLPNSLPSRVVLGLFESQVVPLLSRGQNLQQIQGAAEFASLPLILKKKKKKDSALSAEQSPCIKLTVSVLPFTNGVRVLVLLASNMT